MLACCGLPANLTQQAIEDGFSAYRMTPQSAGRAAALADLKTKYGNRPVTITMIGVWDTVGSLGIPSIIGAVDPIRHGFLDTKLSGSVKAAYQALAIDERRRSFPPTLWVADNVPGQILEQVWFTGCHSSVGGGCPDAGLSNITLKWMLQKGQQHGLEIDPAVLKIYMAIDAAAHGLDQIQESWSILWGIPAVRSVSDDSTLASTVPSRLTHLADYKPCNLKLTAARAVAPSYTIMTV
jgi:hypothetical protein